MPVWNQGEAADCARKHSNVSSVKRAVKVGTSATEFQAVKNDDKTVIVKVDTAVFSSDSALARLESPSECVAGNDDAVMPKPALVLGENYRASDPSEDSMFP